MNNALLIARENFGMPGQRKIGWLDRFGYLNVPRPSWCTVEDDLYALFENKWKLLKNGIVVWGHLVQANSLLFEPGSDNCPASVIFPNSERSPLAPEQLAPIARAMFDLKNTSGNTVELQEVADSLTDELMRTFGLRVPSQLSHGHEIFEASTFITRKHLPTGVLSIPFFPLVVSPEPPYYNVPLPSRYWPEPLVQLWETQG